MKEMSIKKETTPARENRRRYEERNKEKRQLASKSFQAMLPRAEFDEIEQFVFENGLSKVQYMRESLELMKQKYNK